MLVIAYFEHSAEKKLKVNQAQLHDNQLKISNNQIIPNNQNIINLAKSFKHQECFT